MEGLLLGAVDFVSKPFQREELLARVRTHLELAHLRSELETRVAQRTAELNNAIEQLRLEVVERRRMERALREGEQQLRQITNIAPVIIWTSGPEHRIDSRNEYAQAFTGRTMEELVGDRWAEVVHPEDLEIQRDGYLQGVQTRNIFQLEYRIRRADGEYRWMLDKGTPRFLPNGAFAGYVGVIFDFTDVSSWQAWRCVRETSKTCGCWRQASRTISIPCWERYSAKWICPWEICLRTLPAARASQNRRHIEARRVRLGCRAYVEASPTAPHRNSSGLDFARWWQEISSRQRRPHPQGAPEIRKSTA